MQHGYVDPSPPFGVSGSDVTVDKDWCRRSLFCFIFLQMSVLVSHRDWVRLGTREVELGRREEDLFPDTEELDT